MYNINVCGTEPECQILNLRNVRSFKNLHLPCQSLFLDKLNARHQHLKNIPIVDYINAQPKVLIGIDNCHVGLMNEVNYGENEPVCIRTKLGTIVYGPTDCKISTSSMSSLFVTREDDYKLDELNRIAKDYFTTENFDVKSVKVELESDSDLKAQQIMKSTTKRKNERYETGLLWRYQEVKFPPSISMAIRRLNTVEKIRDMEYAIQYKKKY